MISFSSIAAWRSAWIRVLLLLLPFRCARLVDLRDPDRVGVPGLSASRLPRERARERRIQREKKIEKVRDKEGEKVAVGYPVFGTNDITIRIQTQHIKQPRTPCPIMPARPEAMPALGQAGSDSQSNAAAGVNSELGFGNRSRILSITASPGADRAPPYQLVVVGRIDMIMHATAAMPTWPLQLPWGSSRRLLCGGFGSLDDVGLGLKLVVALPFCKSVRTYANFRGLE